MACPDHDCCYQQAKFAEALSAMLTASQTPLAPNQKTESQITNNCLSEIDYDN